MVAWWLHAFTLWYVLTLLYMGKRSWSGGVFVGAITCWGIIGGMGEHLKVYFLDQEGRGVEDRWVFLVFDIPIILSLFYLFIKFALNTTAPRILKIGLGVLSVLMVAFFSSTNEDVQDFAWHSKHSVLHLATAAGTGVTAFYLDREKQEANKKVE